MHSLVRRLKIRWYWWVVVLALGIVVWLPTARFNAVYLEGVINRTVIPATRGLYCVEIGDVSFSLLAGDFSASDLRLVLNDTVLDSLEGLGLAPAVRFEGELGKASIEGVSFFRLLSRGELEADRILLRQPQIDINTSETSLSSATSEVFQPSSGGDADSASIDQPEAVKVSLDELPFLSIDRLVAEDVGVDLRIGSGPAADESQTDLSQRLEGFSFMLLNLRIDPSRLNDPRSLALTADAELEVDHLHLELGDESELDVDSVSASTLDSTLHIGRVNWTPTYTEEDYLSGEGASRDRIAASLRSIHLSDVGYHSLVSQLELHVQRGTIDGFTINVLSDKRRATPESDVVEEQFMPHWLMQRLPVGLEVDTLKLANSTVQYAERGIKGSLVGSITFEGLNATVTQFSNRPSQTADRPTLIEAQAKLFGVAPVEVAIELPLMLQPPSMHVRARASGFDPQIVNAILPALEGMRINGGQVDSAWLDIEFGPEVATGHVTAVYRDLDIRIESPETGEQNLVRKLATVGAKVALHGANDPAPDQTPRSGKVDYEISLEKPFFEIFWEAIRDGLLRLVRAI